MSGKRFVKSADTKTPVVNSKSELERMLKRYGASAIAFSEDYDQGKASVFFRVPDEFGGSASVPVRLEVDFEAVRVAMYGKLKPGSKWTDHGRAQSERVAWRHLVLWVDAALSAASAGVQRISEAFLAHTLVLPPGGGKALRVVDLMDQQAGGNWKALLPPGNPS